MPHLIGQQPTRGEARQQPDDNACREQLQAEAQDDAQHLTTAGAQREPDGDLFRLP